ncbi:SDR family oxidoreductase [Radicibacter daui]|uniref:SDR family oxidoreductase n=1 Tax=Radicibacter daui TaxID=3064829 RepID=UPI004046D957
MKLLIFGMGFTGKALARAALRQGVEVAGTVRRREKLGSLTDDPALAGLELLSWPFSSADTALAGVTHLIATAPPAEPSATGGAPGFCDPLLAECSTQLRERAGALWTGYLSTTGVYGDHGGARVDEETPPAPSSPRSARRLESEREWQQSGLDPHIFRLPGIYGPGRSVLDQLRQGTARRIVKPGHVFSRIHVEDIAAAVLAAMALPPPGRLYNIADNEPAPNADVIAFGAGLLEMAPPPEIAFDEASLSEMALSFWQDNRRVSNTRARTELGWQPIYPTYREGLSAILAAGG